MSGGVGPSDDIGLPKEAEPPLKTSQAPIQPRNRFLSFRQLNALAVIVVLAASGMVPVQDVAFPFFSIFYIYFLSKVAFPTLNSSPDPPVFGEKNRILGIYVMVGALVGLLLPIVYIFLGIVEGDKEGIKAAVPHVLLLSSQVFMEGVTFSRHYSLPIRAFVPVVFNGYRLISICYWLNSEIGKIEEEHGTMRRVYVGRALAVANLIFWAFNLFGFLLPVYLPRAFKRYYGYKEKA